MLLNEVIDLVTLDANVVLCILQVYSCANFGGGGLSTVLNGDEEGIVDGLDGEANDLTTTVEVCVTCGKNQEVAN